jgi:hypothetical protein
MASDEMLPALQDVHKRPPHVHGGSCSHRLRAAPVSLQVANIQCEPPGEAP